MQLQIKADIACLTGMLYLLFRFYYNTLTPFKE